MKTNLKFITASVCFYFATVTVFGQSTQISPKTPATQNTPTNNTAFLGIWELFKVSTNGLPLQNYPPGYIKIYNADGTFAIIRVQNTGSIIKGSGYYAIDNDLLYREADKAEDLVTKGFKISYEFSADKKVLTIGFSYNNGTAFTEAYRKLEPAKP